MKEQSISFEEKRQNLIQENTFLKNKIYSVEREN